MSHIYQRLVTHGAMPPPRELVLDARDRLSSWLDDYLHTYHACGLRDASTYVMYSSRAVLPGGVKPAAISIRNGKIVAIDESGVKPTGPTLIDYHDLVISPGVIDVHVHLNEPGREDWEGGQSPHGRAIHTCRALATPCYSLLPSLFPCSPCLALTDEHANPLLWNIWSVANQTFNTFSSIQCIKLACC